MIKFNNLFFSRYEIPNIFSIFKWIFILSWTFGCFLDSPSNSGRSIVRRGAWQIPYQANANCKSARPRYVAYKAIGLYSKDEDHRIVWSGHSRFPHHAFPSLDWSRKCDIHLLHGSRWLNFPARVSSMFMMWLRFTCSFSPTAEYGIRKYKCR